MRSLLFCAMLLAQFTMAQPKQTKVTVYTGDFTGMKEELAVGRYNNLYLAQSGISFVGSVRVPAGMKVTLFAEDNHTGSALTIMEDATTRYLKAKGFAEIGLQVSVIVELLAAGELPVTPPYITLYQNNFAGASKNLSEGRYESHDFGLIENDQVSSVKVPKGMKITLYEHGGYAGRSLVLTQDATTEFLIKNKFNDAASSVWIESIPVEEKKPVPVVLPVKKDSVIELPTGVQTDEIVTIFQGDFNGVSKTLVPGKYTLAMLGIGNDELSSISIKPGYRVVLFMDDNFKGKSVKLTEGANTAKLNQLNFNNVTSSLIIEEIPTVKISEGSLGTASATLFPGHYDLDLLMDYNIMDNEISSVQVPAGYRVILYELEKFKGRSLILTQDASTEFLTDKNFNNVTSSLTVEEWEETKVIAPRPMVTLYDLNFSGRSQTLAPGTYEYQDLIMGNNAVSSVTVPYGLRVTLYEYGAQEGRAMTLTKNADSNFFNSQQFDNITTSVVVTERPESELYVIVYADRYAGNAQQLKPGKYRADDLLIGNKQLSSIRVPHGLVATLFENGNFTGLNITLDRDTDFSDSKLFNNLYSSVMVEDVTTPIVTPVVVTTVITESPAPVADTVIQIVEASEPDCSFTEKEYYTALKTIESKPFSAEKMQTARMATEGKCLTNEQIRAIAKTFDFEDQTLEFVLYAYDRAIEKSMYYTLEDVFKFMSSKDRFNKFLSEKK